MGWWIAFTLAVSIPGSMIFFRLTRGRKPREYWAEDFDVPRGPRDEIAP